MREGTRSSERMKLIESKKRLRQASGESGSDEYSDWQDVVSVVARGSGKGPVGRKKKEGPAARKKGRKARKDQKDMDLSEEDPFEFREEAEISRRSAAMRQDGRKRFGIGKRRNVDSAELVGESETKRKRVTVEDCEEEREEGEENRVPSPGAKNAGAKQGEVETESSAGEKSTLSSSNNEGGSVPERSKGVDWLNKKVFSLERVNGFRLVSKEKDTCISSDKVIKLQGRGGVLKVLPPGSKLKAGDMLNSKVKPGDMRNSKVKVGDMPSSKVKAGNSPNSKEKAGDTPNSKMKACDMPNSQVKACNVPRVSDRRESVDRLKNTVSPSVSNQKSVVDAPLSGGKNKLETSSGASAAMTKDEKLGKRKVHEMEQGKPETRPGMEPKNMVSKDSPVTPKKRERESLSTVDGAGSGGKKVSSAEKAPTTEKQMVRSQIKSMLIDAGWKLDYRPRKDHTYNDCVYISPTGTGYWSIVKAFNAYKDQLGSNGEGSESLPVSKRKGKSSMISSVPVSSINMLMRKSSLAKHGTEVNEKAKEGGKVNFANDKRAIKLRKVKIKAKGFVRRLQSGKRDNEADYDMGGVPADAPEGARKSVEKQRGCALLVRRSGKEATEGSDGFTPYAGKRTVLSWLIDSGALPDNAKVQYMNRRHTHGLLDGWITRDGIHCSCCSKIVSLFKFELHAGSRLRQPFQNIIAETGLSLLQCQLDAWNKQEESKRLGFQFIDVDGDDPNDDTCGICGDGGDLICCDGCPSTFHQFCLNIKKLPPGDWYCSNCSCKYCGSVGGTDQVEDSNTPPLLSCSQCEEKYHQSCIPEVDGGSVISRSPYTSFCGPKCRKLFQQLNKLLGVKNDLEGGFSWTLVHRFDEESEGSSRSLPLRADCNSKLAVALAAMDECFLPIIDRRSGINVIHNAVYNRGSNFSRLNYGGFYTVILERSDEIISVASLRIHGTRLAEMPFIGTRHIYRRQGMCRRLLNAIESVLGSLNVEKLIIPAISDLMDTWTVVFGFKPLEESHRREMRSMNMLVFPGTDLLQKQLVKHDSVGGNADDAAISVTEVNSNGNHTYKEDNETLAATSEQPYGHDSYSSEVKDTVAASEPSCHAFVGSSAEGPINSQDISDGSSPRTLLEEAKFDKSAPDDECVEPSCGNTLLHVDGATEIKKNNEETQQEKSGQIDGSASDGLINTQDISHGSSPSLEEPKFDKSCPDNKRTELGCGNARLHVDDANKIKNNNQEAQQEQIGSIEGSAVEGPITSQDISHESQTSLEEVKRDNSGAEDKCMEPSSRNEPLCVVVATDIKSNNEHAQQEKGVLIEGSAAVGPINSQDSSHGSSQTSLEAAEFDKCAPDDKCMEPSCGNALFHVDAATEIENNNEDAQQEKSGLIEGFAPERPIDSQDISHVSSPQASLEEAKFDNSGPDGKCMEPSCGNELLHVDGATEIGNNNEDAHHEQIRPVEASAVEGPINPPDISYGSCSQTSLEEAKFDDSGAEDKCVEPCSRNELLCVDGATDIKSNNEHAQQEKSGLIERSVAEGPGSSSQTSLEGAEFDNSGPEDKCVEPSCGNAILHVDGANEIKNNEDAWQEQIGPGDMCSLGPQLRDLDIGEVKDMVAVSVRNCQAVGSSTAEVDVSHGSSSHAFGEGAQFNENVTADKLMESSFEKVFLDHEDGDTEVKSNNEVAQTQPDGFTDMPSLGSHLHGSCISRVEDRICHSEPTKVVGSVFEGAVKAVDAPASISQASGEGLQVSNSEMDDKSTTESEIEKSIVVHVDSTTMPKSIGEDPESEQNVSVDMSSSQLHLHDSCISEGKHSISYEPSSRVFGCSTAVGLPQSVNVPYESSSQVSGEGARIDISVVKDKIMELNFEESSPGHVNSGNEIDSNREDTQEEENLSVDLSSSGPSFTSKPGTHALGDSTFEAAVQSVHAPHISHSQASEQGAQFCKSELEDTSADSNFEKSSFDLVDSSAEIKSNNEEAEKAKNGSVDISSSVSHFRDACVSEEKDPIFASEPHSPAFEVSTTEGAIKSVDVPHGSSCQVSGEGALLRNTLLDEKFIDSDFEKASLDRVDRATEIKSCSGNMRGEQNASVVMALGSDLHDSNISELKDTAANSGPSSHAFGGSAVEGAVKSVDVSHGSGSQESDEGNMCGEQNASVGMSLGSDLHDSNISEVKDTAANSGHCSHAFGASAVERAVKSVDVSHGSSSQESGEGMVHCNNSELKDKFTESNFEKAYLDHANSAAGIKSSNEEAEKEKNDDSFSLGPHFRESCVSEEKDPTATSEPCNLVFEASNTERALISVDVPHGSSCQVSGEGNQFKKSILDGKSTDSVDPAFLHQVDSTTEIKSSFANTQEEQNTSVDMSLGSDLRDFDTTDIKDTDANSEPSHGASPEKEFHHVGSAMDCQSNEDEKEYPKSPGILPTGSQLHVFDAGQDACPSASFPTAIDEANCNSELQHNSRESGHTKASVNDVDFATEFKCNDCDAYEGDNGSSVVPHLDDSNVSVVAASEPSDLAFQTTSAELDHESLDSHQMPDSQLCGSCPPYDSYEPLDKSGDFMSVKAIDHHDGDETAPDDVSLVISLHEPNHLSDEVAMSGECGTLVTNTNVKSELHPVGETCLQTASEVLNDSPDAVSGSGFDASGVSQHCASGVSLSLVSVATHCDRPAIANEVVSAPDSSLNGCGESIEQKTNEAEVSSVGLKAHSSHKESIQSAEETTQITNSVSENDFQASDESRVQCDTKTIESLHVADHSFPPGNCSMQLTCDVGHSSLLSGSDATLAAVSNVYLQGKQDIVNEPPVTPHQSDQLVSCEAGQFVVQGVLKDASDINYESHALGKYSVIGTLESSSVSQLAALNSISASSGRGKVSEVLYMSHNPSGLLIQNLDTECHSTQDVAIESGGDFPDTSRFHTSDTGIVPDIHGIESVDPN